MNLREFTLMKLAGGFERDVDLPTRPTFEGGKIDRWKPGSVLRDKNKAGPMLKTNIDDYPVEDVNVKQGRY